MKNTIKMLILLIIIAVIAVLASMNPAIKSIKIGVITPITGGAAYWGESSIVGIRMAQKELREKGVEIEVITEDGQLSPAVALTATQKLVNVDGVDAIYSEFNPAAVSVSSFLKDKDVFHLYDAAVVSPLKDSANNFKTYLDYKNSCNEVSRAIKDSNGITKVGVLKMNLEHADLCLEGIISVFGTENVIVESYNPGVTDFRTMLSKIKKQNVDAIFHASFQPETLASLRQIEELGGRNEMFVGLAETITPDIIDQYRDLIEGDVFFGLPKIGDDLMKKIDLENGGKAVADYNAAALAYIHIKQLGEALSVCDDNACVASKLSSASPVESAGFLGFKDRVAKFENRIVKFAGGEFVDVK